MLTKYAIHKLFLLICAFVVLHASFLSLSIEGQLDWSRLRYFTILSNAWVGVGFLLMALLEPERHDLRTYVSLAVLIPITVTGLVYNLVLVPLTGANPVYVGYSNLVTHLLATVMVLVNYMVFEPKGLLKVRHLPAGVVPGLLYWVVSMVVGSHPYFFMDPVAIGWVMTGVWLVGLVVVMGLLTAGLFVYDRIKGKPKQYVREQAKNPYEDVF